MKDGILLLEVNRMLRGGGYFVWAAQPVYKHEPILEEQWEGKLPESAFLMLSLSLRKRKHTQKKKREKREILICWELWGVISICFTYSNSASLLLYTSTTIANLNLQLSLIWHQIYSYMQ